MFDLFFLPNFNFEFYLEFFDALFAKIGGTLIYVMLNS